MRCPICGITFSPEKVDAALPFCSQRCKSIDLNRWFNEEYSVETVNVDQLEREIAGLEQSNSEAEAERDER